MPDGPLQDGPESPVPLASPPDAAADHAARAERGVASGAAKSNALEEVLLPAAVQPPAALAGDVTLGPDARLRIVEHTGVRGRLNVYTATWQDEAGETVPAEVREGLVDDAPLAHEAAILAGASYAMLPKYYADFTQDGRRYLVLAPAGTSLTLEQALRDGRRPAEAISIALQLAQAMRRLHQVGWALVGLAPAAILLDHPVRINSLAGAARIGERLPQPWHVPGYSAPELAQQTVITGREDVYTLGALLYHALAGQSLPESGVEQAALPTLMQTPGAPQLLWPALAPVEERIDLESFYQHLLDYKQRLSRVSLALEVASSTTVGLNPTRPVNEDCCGYLTWMAADAAGPRYRAVLCVADGMGGMEAGEVASQTALHAALGAVFSAGADSSTDAAAPDPVDLVRRAAPAVYAAANGRAMGTTMTCICVDDGRLALGHIGDTRAYLLRDGTLAQLTADHSLVAAMVASGVLSGDEARGHPDSNQVLRSLGSQRALPDGYVDDLSAAYEQPSLQLQSGDWLLLCSDGVWGTVDDAQLRTILTEALDCPSAVHAVINGALRAGAPDNATVIAARCIEMPSR